MTTGTTTLQFNSVLKVDDDHWFTRRPSSRKQRDTMDFVIFPVH